MTLEDFDEGLLKWGADLAGWPDELRPRAEKLLAQSEAARSMREEMAGLATILDTAVMSGVPVGAVSAKVQQSIAGRRERQGLLDLLPLKRIFGWGSLAGIGGGAFAAFAPVGAGVTSMLSIALGGTLP